MRLTIIVSLIFSCVGLADKKVSIEDSVKELKARLIQREVVWKNHEKSLQNILEMESNSFGFAEGDINEKIFLVRLSQAEIRLSLLRSMSLALQTGDKIQLKIYDEMSYAEFASRHLELAYKMDFNGIEDANKRNSTKVYCDLFDAILADYIKLMPAIKGSIDRFK